MLVDRLTTATFPRVTRYALPVEPTQFQQLFVCLFPRQREKSKQTDGSPVALFNYFVDRVRDQLHIVLAMSPIGDAFRNRLRKFPSLVNCCTIDWFQVCGKFISKSRVTKGYIGYCVTPVEIRLSHEYASFGTFCSRSCLNEKVAVFVISIYLCFCYFFDMIYEVWSN